MDKNMSYFTPKEVAIHNKPDDTWVIVNSRVYDLTSLVKEYINKSSNLFKPITLFAGKDVSHWFDRETEEFLHYIDVSTGERFPFIMHGLIPHVASDSQNITVVWWQDPQRQVGWLTKHVRPVRIINTLTGLSTLMETCCEDKCGRIKERYAALGFDIPYEAYTWKAACTGLTVDDMATLEENGIRDEFERFEDVGLPTDLYVPALLLYYNDVITDPYESTHDEIQTPTINSNEIKLGIM